jgi:hypothetical protein
MQLFKKNKNVALSENNYGVGLILTIMIVTLMLFLGMYYLNLVITEKFISRSQSWGNKTYYLAEAGINEAVWLIKNDLRFKNDFENDPSWATTTIRIDPFGPNTGRYDVTLTNSSRAHAEVISTGSLNLGSGVTTQRVVKTFVYKAVGTSDIEDSTGYADGNIDISASNINFYAGSAHSNNTFTVNNSSNVNVPDSNIKSVGNYLEHITANVTIGPGYRVYAANYPPAPVEINMPAVDFDFYKDWAIASGTYFTDAQFETILENNMNVILSDPVTYVDGDVEVKGARTLSINQGLLVVDRDFEIGFKKNWEGGNGPSSLYITYASGTPSGILTGRHVNFFQYTDTVNVEGVVYASDEMYLTNLDSYTNQFDVVGGLIARKLTFTSCWLPSYINLTHDDNILSTSLGVASSSHVIVVEHWEEEY